MNLKKITTFIRGWLPQEPKLAKNVLNNSPKPIQSSLRLTNSLKIVYALTLGFALMWFLLHVTAYTESSISIITITMWNLPNIFLYNIPALTIFGVVFLTKGNGLNYFRSWKAGRKVHLSILSIVLGYFSIALQDFYFPTSASFNIRNTRLFGFFIGPSYYFLIFLGLSLMTLGFVSLMLLGRGSRKNQAMSLN